MSKVFRLTITFTKASGFVLMIISSILSYLLKDSVYFVTGVGIAGVMIVGQNYGNQFGKKCNENT
jgi:hypothetical protein